MTEFRLGEHVTVSHRLSRIPYSAVRHPDFTKPGGDRTLPDRLEAVPLGKPTPGIIVGKRHKPLRGYTDYSYDDAPEFKADPCSYVPVWIIAYDLSRRPVEALTEHITRTDVLFSD